MALDSERGSSLTRTETDDHKTDACPTTLGILWLEPEERFFELESGATFGRAEHCQCRLQGASVSRQHATVERNGSLWVLRDLGSKNGTFINATRRERGPVGPGDTVRIGDWVGVLCRMPKLALKAKCWFGELPDGVLLGAPTLSRLSNIPSIAASDLPVVVLGETGTGKERVARALHQLSGRTGPLVAVNCSAIPESLAEAELFGHRKGAFTGASEAAPGRIASAHGGTLLLDEIVDLPLSIQGKLLRTLEDKTVVPVGSAQAVPVNFRVIAASQVRLETLVRTGVFRGDLYARLSGVELELPPLRERREEVLALLRHSMQAESGTRVTFDASCAEHLCAYDWPYNVRELVQLGRLLGMSSKRTFALADLPMRLREARTSGPGGVEAGSVDLEPRTRRTRWLSRHAAELGQLMHALRTCDGNVAEASRITGIPRHRARRLLEAEAERRSSHSSEPRP